MALFSKKNLKSNPYGLTRDVLKGDIVDVPMGIVVRMLEEQELQGNKPNVKVFQASRIASRGGNGFNWNETEAGQDFWYNVIKRLSYDLFFEKYPDYKKYNL